MRLEPVPTLQRLIQAPSVNPMGRDLAGAGLGEARMTDLLVEICQQQGWRWSRRQVHPGRDNLIALVEGQPPPAAGGELLLWDAHQDTVSADGMTIEPFEGIVRGDRVYGRGACDVKGSMAAMLAALSRSSEERASGGGDGRSDRPRPTILLACTVNEECGFTGAQALAGMWSRAGGPVAGKESDLIGGELAGDAFCPRRPDAAVVAEPTGLSVVVAHQGVVRWRCHVLGRAAHTSRPDEGRNAIYAMSRVVQAIEQYHGELATVAPAHPRCGQPSVCVSTIHGGVGVNTVPERATIEIDRRLSPAERPDEAYDRLVRFIAEQVDAGECEILHDAPFMEGAGLRDDRNGKLAERVAELVRSAGRRSDLIGVPFGTDASTIAATGVPTVVFGPGSIAQAHTAEEYLEVGELELAADVFYRIARDGLR